MEDGNTRILLYRHYKGVIMSAMTSQITGVSIVCLINEKNKSSGSLAFVRGILRWPVNSPHKRPVRGKWSDLITASWVQLLLITWRHNKPGQQRQIHYDDVIMTTMASQITSLTVVYSTVYSDADQRKHQSSESLAFVWGIHRDRWIPRTKGQLRGKFFHLMTSLWWCPIFPTTL